MTDLPNPKDAAELLIQLRKSEDARHRRIEGQGLSPQMAMLRSWQVSRLEQTYADLLHSKRYGPACQFFLDDIYAPKDVTQRNHDIIRIHDFMMRFLPASVLRTLTKAIELHTLTETLDEQLLQVLLEEVHVTDSLSAEQYAEGYRLCDNYDERKRQIEMIVEVGRGIERLVKLPFIGWTLRAARRPALRAGWDELQGFLQRGYSSFKRMGNADYFLDTIHNRELQILDQIYAGSPDPFSLDQ